ncbi:biotin transporter BioY [Oricola sp.]|uniref:biotin transporter BioY n=1 Tax=Oricola sp. TaxID=1979950 RepID=UPI0025F22377|nr:biotin transporter BioY [Oricola sp.]MCI5076379.1 biotin transporter BioY [Oricola sp.]
MTLHQAMTIGQERTVLHQFAIALVGSVLLTISAKIAIPFYPVPLTMQTFVVLGLGLALGPRLGVAAVALYLLQGIAGLPVFSGTPEKGIGIAYMTGPTGGYLAGYLLAAFVTGHLAERGWDRSVITAFFAALAGTVADYVPGLLWLGTLVGWDKPVLAWGLTPFLFGDLAKAGLAAAVFPAVWMWLKKRGIA